jgi:REase_DpnII-MboI
MDFLLKDEKTVIEVKKTRDSLRDKEVGSELLVDITRYQAHPECSVLYCFVYDPDGFIRNPRGVEADLEKTPTNGLKVKVFIRP